MTSITNTKLYKLLSPDNQKIANDCADFVERIWKSNMLIRHFTDHGLSHSLRIIKIIEMLPCVLDRDYFTQDEVFVLVLGALLHDIGMQCDLRLHSDVKTIANEKYYAFFDCEAFDAKRELTTSQQREIRKNHHLIASAWMYYSYVCCTKNDFWKAINAISRQLMPCLIDVCAFHSKLDIRECQVRSKTSPTVRTRLIASILRFADELEISNEKIPEIEVNNFVIPPDNSIFWYIHLNTIVTISSKIDVTFTIVEKDRVRYSNYLMQEHAAFIAKNKDVIEVLVENGITITFNNSNDCVVVNDFAIPFPFYVVDYFKVKYAKSMDAELLLRYIRHEISQYTQSATMMLYTASSRLSKLITYDNNPVDLAVKDVMDDIDRCLMGINMVARNSVWEMDMDRGYITPRQEAFRFTNLIMRVCSYFKPEAGRDIKCVFDKEDSQFYGDIDLIEQALYKMIGTSLKLALRGTNIICSLSKQRFSVKCYGNYLPPEKCEEAFVPGIFLGEIISQQFGLHLVREIAKIHSGLAYLICEKEISAYNIPLVKPTIGILQDDPNWMENGLLLLKKLYDEDHRLEALSVYTELISDDNEPLNPKWYSPQMLNSFLNESTYEVEIVFELSKSSQEG